MSPKRNRGIMTSQCNKEPLSLVSVTFLDMDTLKVRLTVLLINNDAKKTSALGGDERPASRPGRYIHRTKWIWAGLA
jgi:hypothetical protein